MGVGAVGRFEEIPLDTHRATLAANLGGVLHGCHAALPAMLRQGRGVIVNLGSIGSRLPQPFATSYIASKWGLAGLTESLRHEVRGRGVEVCGVYPTIVDTPAISRHRGNFTGHALRTAGLPALSPERVAEAVLDVAERPRRAVHLGAAHLAVPAFWMAPELAGRLSAALAGRALFRGPPERHDPGAVEAPMHASRVETRAHASRAVMPANPLRVVTRGATRGEVAAGVERADDRGGARWGLAALAAGALWLLAPRAAAQAMKAAVREGGNGIR